MISRWIVDAAKLCLHGFANWLGFIVPLPDWVSDATGYLYNACVDAGKLLKWMIPNETIYNWLLSTAIVLIGMWLVSKIVGIALKLYDTVLI